MSERRAYAKTYQMPVFDICRKGGLMPRPIRCRRIERLPVYRSFSPDDITAAESVQMTVDEFEALRLLDDEGLTQEACASRMNIARTTVTAIYDSARKKVADALVHGKRLLITGGCCEFEPVELHQIIMEKGSNTMRIAVTYENGEVFQHFGHSEQFKLYDGCRHERKWTWCTGRFPAGGKGGCTDLWWYWHGSTDGIGRCWD